MPVDGQATAVTEEAADDTPFGTLLHFRKDHSVVQPRVLLVAPMSGHFATLLRGTVQVMLPEHDLYITDWKNARDVPLAEGRFGLDEFVDHIIRFLRVMGPGSHVVAVCQPAVPALAAAAVMAEAGDPAHPRSMTLMAGPIDTRVNPTKVNELAKSRPIEWFERHLISAVPWRFPGAFRHVYPGFVQLSAFMSMNLRPAYQRAFRPVPQPGRRRSHQRGSASEVLRRVRRGDGSAGGVLPRDRAAGVPGARPAARCADLARRDGAARGDPPDGSVDGGRRARRHLRDRPDHGGARPVQPASRST